MPQSIRRVQVMKRPGNRSPYWYLRWWEEQPNSSKLKERWKSTKTTVRKRAEQQRREIERELDLRRVSSRKTNWRDFQEAFVKMQISRMPPTTIACYKNTFTIFERVVKPTEIQSITAIVIEDFVDARLKAGVSPATVNRDLRHLKAGLRWAVRRELLDTAPSFHGLFVREPKKNPVVVPEEDFLAMVLATESPATPLCKQSGECWRTFLYLSYYLGLRRGEMFGLSWRDVVLEKSELIVRAPSSKGRKERILPLPKPIVGLLKAWKSQCKNSGPSDAVLAWPFDTYRPLYVDWTVIQLAAGIPDGEHYVPKNFRSSCASALIASNVPTIVVKDFLGHATVATTENYYVNTKPALRAVADVREIKMTASKSTS